MRMSEVRLKAFAVLVALAAALSSSPASALVALYDFNGNLFNSNGPGSVGTIGSPVVGAGTASFGASDGFKLSGVTLNYALETRITISQAGNNASASYGKIFDFADLGAYSVDIGFYAQQQSGTGGDFSFIGTVGPHPAVNLSSFTYGVPVTVGLIRNGSNVSIYINGVQVAMFTETAQANAIPQFPFGGGTEREISLFVDDTITGGQELLAGSVDYIAINEGTTFLDVDAIRNPTISEPATPGIVGLGLAAIGFVRRRRRAA